jgi:hypothetical protein
VLDLAEQKLIGAYEDCQYCSGTGRYHSGRKCEICFAGQDLRSEYIEAEQALVEFLTEELERGVLHASIEVAHAELKQKYGPVFQLATEVVLPPLPKKVIIPWPIDDNRGSS